MRCSPDEHSLCFGVGNDLFKSHQRFPRLHATRAATQPGFLVEPEEPLLETLMLQRPESPHGAECIRCVDALRKRW